MFFESAAGLIVAWEELAMKNNSGAGFLVNGNYIKDQDFAILPRYVDSIYYTPSLVPVHDLITFMSVLQIQLSVSHNVKVLKIYFRKDFAQETQARRSFFPLMQFLSKMA